MKNFLIGILIAAIIIGTGFGVKWEVDSFNAKYNTPIENHLKEVEEETVNDEIKELDLEKCLNTENITYSNISENNSDLGLDMEINSDKKSITLNFDWNKFGPIVGTPGSNHSIQITGFSKTIDNTFIGIIGQSEYGLKLIYLMEDKTLEYTSLFENDNLNYTYEYSTDGKITGEHFETYGKIDGINSIVKLYNADAFPSDAPVGGYKTILAQKADGSFYDLAKILM